MTSNHHNKQVDCLLCTPISAGGSTDTGIGKIWSGSADGTVFMWADESGGGQLDSTKGKFIKMEGGKRR